MRVMMMEHHEIATICEDGVITMCVHIYTDGLKVIGEQYVKIIEFDNIISLTHGNI